MDKGSMRIYKPGTRITTFIMIAMIGVASIAHAQVKISADKNRILIGDPIKITIEAPLQPGATMQFPELTPKIDSFTLLTARRLDTLPGTGMVIRQLMVTVYDSGRFVFPPQTIIYKRNGTEEKVQSNSLEVDVTFPPSALDSAATVLPVRGLLEEPRTWEDYKIWIFAILAVIVLAVGGYFLWRWWKRRPKTPPVVVLPPPDPYTVAWEALQNLATRAPQNTAAAKEWYSELTYTLRNFIETTQGIPALEATTEELIALVSDWPEAPVRDFRQILTLADLVKFAKAEPSTDKHQDMVTLGMGILAAFKPTAPEPPTTTS